MTAVMTQAFAFLSWPLSRPVRAPRPEADDLIEDARSRRDFVNEILTRCPEAVESDYGVSTMMGMFPGDF